MKTEPNLKLKKIREERGLSQNDLSKLTGISVRVIQSYEQGANNLNCAKLRTICIIANALRCSILDITYSDEVIEEHFKKLEKIT